MAAEIKRVHFNALPESVRKRFLDCVNLEDRPYPIHEAKSSWTGALIGWGLLALTGATVMIGTAWIEFGDEANGPFSFLFYAIGAFCLAYGLASVAHRVRLQQTLPWWPGTYVFASHIVDATSDVLTLYPIAGLVDLNAVHHHTNGAYTHTEIAFHFVGGAHVISISNRTQAEQMLDDLAAADKQVVAAARAQDIGGLADLDPFFEARISEDWGAMGPEAPVSVQGEPVARSVPKMLVAPMMACFVAAAVLAPAAWMTRNAANDVVMYNHARSVDTVWAYRDYLRESGYLFGGTVRSTYLPHAVFSEAHKARSVTQLRRFIDEFPESELVPEAERSVHELYENALSRLESRTANPRAAASLGHLFEWLEAHDTPDVDVRFRAPSLESLKVTDEVLQEMEDAVGKVEPISPSFGPSQMEKREQAITNALADGFDDVVAADILTMVHQGRLSDEDTTFDRPTLEVIYGVYPGETLYTSAPTGAPRGSGIDPEVAKTLGLTPEQMERMGIGSKPAPSPLDDLLGYKNYVGIVVEFEVFLHTPGEDPLYLPLTVQPPQTFSVNYTRFTGLGLGGGPSTGEVYDTMALRAFDQLVTEVGRQLYGAG